ncbi:MAG: c-type cytochrome [Bacteroidota bacterium]
MVSILRTLILVTAILLASILQRGAIAQSLNAPDGENSSSPRLIPARTTMVTAWDIPRHPDADSTLENSPRGETIRWGFRLFMHTPREAPQFVRNALTCGNCHLNGGQREAAMPLVGVASVFPEYNKREARMFTLEDRIVGCFMRSENGSAGQEVPRHDSKEVTALAAYISWISEGFSRGERLPWRGRNTISPENLIPVERLSIARGKKLFMEKCSSCHGKDGQGVHIGDKKAGPLWGPDSWNDGAGAARIYTLAGMIRYAMPYLSPGSLTDEEAQQIAAFINSMRRPAYPLKDQDYRVEKLPPDAVYYGKRP